jgi:histidine triad (HIT) family protein
MYCVFCNIVAGTEPAKIRYEDDDVLVIDNRLQWVPVMLLIITKKHMTQEEMWADTITGIAKVAVEIGQRLCPHGFRLVSNFGWDAMQSVYHGHLHILGGTELGPYA